MKRMCPLFYEGNKDYEGKRLDQMRWNLEIGCLQIKETGGKEWMRLVEFPLHLWCRELFNNSLHHK